MITDEQVRVAMIDRYTRALERLSYDPETGLVRWRDGLRAGQVTGHARPKGHIDIRLGNKNIKAHRLAFFAMTGRLPENIDHINGDAGDNRWCNLRECTLAENNQNQKKRVGGTSRFIGVCKYKCGPSWHAKICIPGTNKQKHLGSFATEEEAYEAYKAAKAMYHPFQPTIRIDQQGGSNG